MKPKAVQLFVAFIKGNSKGLSAAQYPSFFGAHFLKGLWSYDLAMARYIRCPALFCQPANSPCGTSVILQLKIAAISPQKLSRGYQKSIQSISLDWTFSLTNKRQWQMAKLNDFKLWTTLYQSSTNCICYNNFALFICFKNQINGRNLMFFAH